MSTPGQVGNCAGNCVPATLCSQQLSVPVVYQARSTANAGLIKGDGAVPFPLATLKRTWSKSGLGSMSRYPALIPGGGA